MNQIIEVCKLGISKIIKLIIHMAKCKNFQLGKLSQPENLHISYVLLQKRNKKYKSWYKICVWNLQYYNGLFTVLPLILPVSLTEEKGISNLPPFEQFENPSGFLLF